MSRHPKAAATHEAVVPAITRFLATHQDALAQVQSLNRQRTGDTRRAHPNIADLSV